MDETFCTLISGYILIGSRMGVDFFPQEENQLDNMKLERGRSLSLCLSFSLISISPLLSLSFTFNHFPPSPGLPSVSNFLQSLIFTESA